MSCENKSTVNTAALLKLSKVALKELYSFCYILDAVSNYPAPLPNQLVEPFLIEPPVGSMERGPEVVNFEHVEEASKQRRTKLIDSRGYTYNVKRRTQSATVWQCSVRTKSTYCKATVKQIEDEFIITQSHNHQPAVGAVTAAKLVDEVPVNPLTRKLICFHGQIIVIRQNLCPNS